MPMDLVSATLEDLKRYRPDLCDLLYDEFLKANSIEKPKKLHYSLEDEKPEVKVGDAIRWNYTGEEGVVVGFESFGGKKIIVQQYDGTKIQFDNNPKLFTILEGKRKEKVLLQKKKHDARVLKDSEPQKTVKTKKKPRFETEVVEDEQDTNIRKSERPKIGDRIRYLVNKKIAVVKGFVNKYGVDRIILKGPKGMPSSIIDNPIY